MKMKKVFVVVFLWCCLFSLSTAQVGIGGGGGLIYPGLSSSDIGNSQFKIGVGYDVFVRHKLIKISENHTLHAKYCVSNYFSDIELSRVGNIRYHFSYLSVEVIVPIKKINSFSIVGGAGLNLINVTATQKYTEDTNESMLLPTLIIGTEYYFSKNYNIFGNLNFQFGEFEDNGQNLPVHGFRFQIGATMFLTE
jgi:hypothetical protein